MTREKKYYKAMGRNIWRRRTLLGISQKALGEFVGVRPQQIQKYESGQNSITFSKACRIAHFLNCHVSELCPGQKRQELHAGLYRSDFEKLRQMGLVEGKAKSPSLLVQNGRVKGVLLEKALFLRMVSALKLAFEETDSSATV